MSAPDTPLSQVPQSRNSLQAAPAVDVMAPAADELGRIAEVLATARANEINKESDLERMRIENVAAKVMEEARVKAKAAPNSTSVQAVYDENTKPLADLRDQLPEGDEQTLFDAAIARRGLAHMVDLETHRSAMLSEETKVALAEQYEGLNQAAANGTYEDVAVGEKAVDIAIARAVGSGAMTDAEAALESRKGKASIQNAYVRGLMGKRQYRTAYEALNSGLLPDLPMEARQVLAAKAAKGVIQLQVMDFVDQVMASGMHPAQQQQMVIDIEDPEMRDQAWTRLRTRQRAAVDAQKASASAVLTEEWYRIQRGEIDPETGEPTGRPLSPEGLLDEFFQRDVPQAIASKLLTVAEKKFSPETNKPVFRTVNDVREMILNGEITDSSDLIPFMDDLGNQFTNVEALLTKRANASERDLIDQAKPFMASAKSKLTATSIFGGIDTVGDEDWFRFQEWFDSELELRLEGVTRPAERLAILRTMTDPNNVNTEEHKDFAGHHIAKFETPSGARQEALMEKVGRSFSGAGSVSGISRAAAQSQPNAPVIAQDEAGTPVVSVPNLDGTETQVAIPTKLPGETYLQWKSRYEAAVAAGAQ